MLRFYATLLAGACIIDYRAESPSSELRAHLRARIIDRIADLDLTRQAAGEAMGFNKSQMSRLMADEDSFSFDRLADAAAGIGLLVRVKATRPWGEG